MAVSEMGESDMAESDMDESDINFSNLVTAMTRPSSTPSVQAVEAETTIAWGAFTVAETLKNTTRTVPDDTKPEASFTASTSPTALHSALIEVISTSTPSVSSSVNLELLDLFPSTTATLTASLDLPSTAGLKPIVAFQGPSSSSLSSVSNHGWTIRIFNIVFKFHYFKIGSINFV